MNYANIRSLRAHEFRRLTGVTRQTFETMIEVVHEAHKKVRKRGGKKPKLAVPDQILLTLSYLREYRTLFHIGCDFGVSESQASRIERFVEDALIKDARFHLPGRKVLREDGVQITGILVDASESPVERPGGGKKKW